uniref:Uncharacterized protein n=1 Tax=Anguilla anguilla TaxID=7936 RepID=A0A0E9XPX4_ANGAN
MLLSVCTNMYPDWKETMMTFSNSCLFPNFACRWTYCFKRVSSSKNSSGIRISCRAWNLLSAFRSTDVEKISLFLAGKFFTTISTLRFGPTYSCTSTNTFSLLPTRSRFGAVKTNSSAHESAGRDRAKVASHTTSTRIFPTGSK